MPQLRAQVLTTEAVTAQLRESMYRLYECYYAATTRVRFRQDLSDKTHTVLLQDENDTLRGFSTLARFDFSFAGSGGQAIFSGDTIVHHEYWGQQVLPGAWLELAGHFKAQQSHLPLYWFLIVKGYRTYRYLSLFARRYFPHYHEATPARLQSLLDHLADARFGSCYDRETGLITFHESLGHLAPAFADVPTRMAQRPEVAFFLDKNAGYVRGDELACITELCSENLTRRARSAFERGL